MGINKEEVKGLIPKRLKLFPAWSTEIFSDDPADKENHSLGELASFHPSTYDDAEVRREVVKRWNAWEENEAATALFNAGHDARMQGKGSTEEPDDDPGSDWLQGWAWADFNQARLKSSKSR